MLQDCPITDKLQIATSRDQGRQSLWWIAALFATPPKGAALDPSIPWPNVDSVPSCENRQLSKLQKHPFWSKLGLQQLPKHKKGRAGRLAFGFQGEQVLSSVTSLFSNCSSTITLKQLLMPPTDCLLVCTPSMGHKRVGLAVWLSRHQQLQCFLPKDVILPFIILLLMSLIALSVLTAATPLQWTREITAEDVCG